MLKKAKNRKERGKSCIEVDSRKHRLYKMFAVKRGMKLKELAELAIDEYTKRKQQMILNLLKLAGVAIGVMAVVLALGYLYVMNEMREEIKKDRGCQDEKDDLGGNESAEC